MPLAAGTRLGVFEILAPLGKVATAPAAAQAPPLLDGLQLSPQVASARFD